LDTVLGERGVGLSEGQVQRIAIARAFIAKAPILVLDEATSALDQKTELTILENLRKIDHLWGCILVSHRETACSCCDKSVSVIKGKIIDKEERNG
jgi:ATP-binding cassette subfamily B protein